MKPFRANYMPPAWNSKIQRWVPQPDNARHVLILAFTADGSKAIFIDGANNTLGLAPLHEFADCYSTEWME